VTEVVWPRPRPHAIAYISPSSAADVETCERRAAFARDPRFRTLKRVSLHAAAGMVAHSVYEHVAAGNYDCADGDDPVAVIDVLWSEATNRVQQILLASWAPAQVPQPDEWPNMARTRRTIMRSQTPRVSPGHAARSPSPQAERRRLTSVNYSVPAHPLPWIEQRLRDENLGIEGIPDRVERHPDGICILDLKSGWNQDEATDAQRRQLLAYAHLVAIACHERPTQAVIDARRGRFSFGLDWAEVTAQADHLADIRSTFNAKVESGADLHASPSAENCRFCRFRLVCESSQEAISEEWRLPLVVTGLVDSVEALEGRIAVDLRITYPSWRVDTLARVVGVPWSAAPSIGDTVSITGLHSSSDGRTLNGSWNSLAYVLGSSARPCGAESE